ncbi:RNA polymerase sigma factor [Nocardia asteroides]|uniref:RNA polymerase sigma factor n=1 Tax=Nocardia asteroides TaxID=1824 RepID=UPI0037C705E8
MELTDDARSEPIAAFRALYEREYQRVRSHLMVALRGNISRVEDLTHEVFLEVWHRHGRAVETMSPEHVQAILITTANHRTIDLFRREKRERIVADPTDGDIYPTTQVAVVSDHSEHVISSHLLDRFWRLLREDLTHREFQVAYLSWAVGMSGSEVASRLQTTPTAVYQVKSAARKKIGLLIKREEHHHLFGDGGVSAGISPFEANVTGGGQNRA